MARSLKLRLFETALRCTARIDEPFYSVLTSLANSWIRFRGKEREVSLGPLHPDKTFYVIRDFPDHIGLAGWYDRVLGYMERAERKGWIPVVIPPPADESFRDAGDWYAYFDPPSSFPPEEVLKSAHVVFAVQQAVVYKRFNRREIARRHRLARAIPPKREIREWLEERAARILDGMPEGKRIGANYRGTDYRRAVGHAAVPDVDAWCDLIQADMERWGVDAGSDQGASLFVSTEEKEALDAILKRFPKARFVERERFSKTDGGVCMPHRRLERTSTFDNNRLYLLDLYLLSKCDYVASIFTGGLSMALNWNGNAYRDVHVIKWGIN